MRKKLFVGIVIALLAQSCIPSLHPLYTEETLAFENALLGTWTDPDGDGDLTLEKAAARTYKLTFQEPGKEKIVSEVHLVKLGKHYFLDFYPWNDNKDSYPELSVFRPVIHAHTFAEVRWTEDALTLNYFDQDWLEGLFKQRKIRIKHELLAREVIVLTAPTEELQQFVTKYIDDPDTKKVLMEWKKAI